MTPLILVFGGVMPKDWFRRQADRLMYPMALPLSWCRHAAHWTEWFDRDLAWGTTLEAASSVVGGVVLAPLVEEVAFRGLLYATLRRRLGWLAAALLSSALFALPHGYGLGGSLSVFVSGVVWAWGYERTGSLLPGIAAHAANNLWASFVVLDVFRA
jgi:hypothetical protein